uniref:DUF1677 family protein n=1 Tax=Oryza brachyantha TaxID=4533 RepID=J3KXD4_ORYBR
SNKMEKLIIMSSGSSNPRPGDGDGGGGAEVETVRCACCGVAEECTAAYIVGVRAAFCGDWLCGLCSEAVKEVARRDPAGGGGGGGALSLAGSMRRIARRSFDKRTSASCQERRLGAAASKAVALARSASCDPRFLAEVIGNNNGAASGDRCR